MDKEINSFELLESIEELIETKEAHDHYFEKPCDNKQYHKIGSSIIAELDRKKKEFVQQVEGYCE